MNKSVYAYGFSVALENYLKCKYRELQKTVAASSEWLDTWVELKTSHLEANRKDGRFFNPLTFIPIKEPIHSSILGDFLRPDGSHGQGPLFLYSLLNYLKVPQPEQGKWSITVETDRVDLMLQRKNPAYLVIIENKLNDAIDQPNQLYRYWHKQVYSRIVLNPEAVDCTKNCQIIYLTSDKHKQPSPQSLQRPDYLENINPYASLPIPPKVVTAGEIFDCWHKTALCQIPASNHRLRTFFHLYSELF